MTDVQKLLKKAVIEVEFDDELSTIRITKCRPDAASSLSDSQAGQISLASSSSDFMEEQSRQFSLYPELQGSINHFLL